MINSNSTKKLMFIITLIVITSFSFVFVNSDSILNGDISKIDNDSKNTSLEISNYTRYEPIMFSEKLSKIYIDESKMSFKDNGFNFDYDQNTIKLIPVLKYEFDIKSISQTNLKYTPSIKKENGLIKFSLDLSDNLKTQKESIKEISFNIVCNGKIHKKDDYSFYFGQSKYGYFTMSLIGILLVLGMMGYVNFIIYGSLFFSPLEKFREAFGKSK